MSQARTLGEKIKNLRQKANMGQFKLELAIGAAPGSISRIESGKVNPTKETILLLGKALTLKEKELADLMEVRSLYPTKEEIELALEETGDIFDREDIYAYLVDGNSVIHAVSKGFVKLFGFTDQDVTQMMGKNILQVIFYPKFGIMQYVDFERSKEAAAIEVARILREQSAPSSDLQALLSTLPFGSELMNLAQNISVQDIIAAKKRKVHIRIDGQLFAFNYSKENLRVNFRFGVVKYYNPILVNEQEHEQR